MIRTEMRYLSLLTALVAVLALVVVVYAPVLMADDLPEGAPAGPEAAEEKSDEPEVLTERQKRLAKQLEEFRQMLSRNAEFEQRTNNPRRAAVLRKAHDFAHTGRTGEDDDTAKKDPVSISVTMDSAAKLLESRQFSDAEINQKRALLNLQSLLKMLLAENRGERLRDDQQRIKEYIKELERLIRIQRGLQGQTEGGADTTEIAKAQGETADRTGKLDDQIAKDEAHPGGKPGDGDSDGKSDGKSDGSSDGDSKGDSEGDSKGDSEGDSKGDSEGDSKGDSEGDSKGDSEGDSKGDSEGDSKGDSEGDSKGDSEGDSKGDSEGDSKGDSEGDSKGDSEGDSKGDSEGDSKGDSEGDSKGDSEGDSKGDSEGDSKGDSEGNSKGDSEGDSKGDSEGNSKGDSEGDSKGDSEGDSKGNSEGDSKGDSEGDSKGDSSGDSKGDSSGNSKGDSNGPSQEDENPARQRIQAAEEKMRRAQQQLEEAKRKEAVEEQEEARKLLEEAKAELEEILRQLREEEIERMLAMLEGRFTKMLQMQLRVYEGTLRLDRIPKESRGREFDVRSGNLSFDQRKIAFEAEKALTLLREEGSSVAFPEAVDQMREDMNQVAARLAQSKTGRITQPIEEDIIAALEEIIEALKKAQEDPEDQPPMDGQPPPPGQPQDQPLVDQIAELKMIRALQVRVNKRTTRYAAYLEDEDDPVGQATEEDLQGALRGLGVREDKIQGITRDIVLGKNQ